MKFCSGSATSETKNLKKSPFLFNTMRDFDSEIEEHKKALRRLQELKANQRPPKKVKSLLPVGRPRINEKRIEEARELARHLPLPLVAMKTELALSSLYRYGIKRKILNAEKELIEKCDSAA